MAQASAVLPLFSAEDLAPLRQAARAGVEVVGGAAQVIGFAAVMWLVLAGPGFVADHASTAPAQLIRR